MISFAPWFLLVVLWGMALGGWCLGYVMGRTFEARVWYRQNKKDADDGDSARRAT